MLDPAACTLLVATTLVCLGRGLTWWIAWRRERRQAPAPQPV
ncbi:hypothetical protein [Micromonospora sp. RP3T]|nr:hypothetical protein [Micromonospora sp. RP3T]